MTLSASDVVSIFDALRRVQRTSSAARQSGPTAIALQPRECRLELCLKRCSRSSSTRRLMAIGWKLKDASQRDASVKLQRAFVYSASAGLWRLLASDRRKLILAIGLAGGSFTETARTKLRRGSAERLDHGSDQRARTAPSSKTGSGQAQKLRFRRRSVRLTKDGLHAPHDRGHLGTESGGERRTPLCTTIAASPRPPGQPRSAA